MADTNNNRAAMERGAEAPSMTKSFLLYCFFPYISIVLFRLMENSNGIELPTWKISDFLQTDESNVMQQDPIVDKIPYYEEKKTSKDKKRGENPNTERIRAETIKKKKKVNNEKSEISEKDADKKYQDEVSQAIERKKQQRKQKRTSSSKEEEDEEEQYAPENYGREKLKDQTQRIDEMLKILREEYSSDPQNIQKALSLAETLRLRDYNIHDGGSAQAEAIKMYKVVLKLLQKAPKSPHYDNLIASVHINLGKTYFVANMFDPALESFESALQINSSELDALSQKGAVLYILGRFKESADAYLKLVDEDVEHEIGETYTGLSKVLVADENSVKGGWDPFVKLMNSEIKRLTKLVNKVDLQSTISEKDKVIYDNLKRLHQAMFLYHDVKTLDIDQAWNHLSKGIYYKMAVLPPWITGSEKRRVSLAKSVFHKRFWPDGVGSSKNQPIFIIGFVRCGSTLLERMFDSHPQIAGTGEDSVFNGRLDYIRNEIVEVSNFGLIDSLARAVDRLANEVVEGYRSRLNTIQANTHSYVDTNKTKPLRFTDKMLSNFMNVGFINMLFPDALILHVVREPMDTLFSAYKHDFPPSALDYTCQFPSLAELYLSYRDMMDHWDNVLPGRVKHIRYEDLVKDMPNIAPAIIAATGLEWHSDVLNFHKKKHAVNTLSTHQVRKGVYSHHINSWKRYEHELQPLVKLIGNRITYNVKTNLPGYTPTKKQKST